MTCFDRWLVDVCMRNCVRSRECEFFELFIGVLVCGPHTHTHNRKVRLFCQNFSPTTVVRQF